MELNLKQKVIFLSKKLLFGLCYTFAGNLSPRWHLGGTMLPLPPLIFTTAGERLTQTFAWFLAKVTRYRRVNDRYLPALHSVKAIAGISKIDT